jgi:RNA polymerase sigma-70 factor (ECF subfamily)
MKQNQASNNRPPGRVESPVAEEDRQRDEQDIDRFLAGDSEGFGALMKRYQRQAYAIALSLTGNHDDAMDVVQKSFLRIHRALPRFRRGEPFFPWLYRIVRNAALNQRRDEKRHRGDLPLEWVRQSDGRPSPLAETLAADLRERLWDAIQSLPLEQREVFVLYHFQGMKYRQIAELLQIPLGTVMSRLHGARLQLRQELEEELR